MAVLWNVHQLWRGRGNHLDFEIRERPDDLGGPSGLRYDVFCRDPQDDSIFAYGHLGNHCSWEGAMAIATEADDD